MTMSGDRFQAPSSADQRRTPEGDADETAFEQVLSAALSTPAAPSGLATKILSELPAARASSPSWLQMFRVGMPSALAAAVCLYAGFVSAELLIDPLAMSSYGQLFDVASNSAEML